MKRGVLLGSETKVSAHAGEQMGKDCNGLLNLQSLPAARMNAAKYLLKTKQNKKKPSTFLELRFCFGLYGEKNDILCWHWVFST